MMKKMIVLTSTNAKQLNVHIIVLAARILQDLIAANVLTDLNPSMMGEFIFILKKNSIFNQEPSKIQKVCAWI